MSYFQEKKKILPHDHSTNIKIRRFTSSIRGFYFTLQLHSDPPTATIMSFVTRRYRSESHRAHVLNYFYLECYCGLEDLRVYLVIWQNIPGVRFSDVSSQLDLGYSSLAGRSQKSCCALLIASDQVAYFSICITDDAHFDHSIKIYKVTLPRPFFFKLTSILWGRYFETT